MKIAKIIVIGVLGVCSMLYSDTSSNSYFSEWRVGLGYNQKSILDTQTTDTNTSDYGGHLILQGDYFYKRFKLGALIDAGLGSNAKSNSFAFFDWSLKAGLNLISLENPFIINVGLYGDSYRNGSRKGNDYVGTGFFAVSVGLEGRFKAGEKLRYEYSADYDYALSREYGVSAGNGNILQSYYGGSDGSYGIRVSFGFAYQLAEDIFYFIRLKAKYQNINYASPIPAAQNIVGMLEIGLGGAKH